MTWGVNGSRTLNEEPSSEGVLSVLEQQKIETVFDLTPNIKFTLIGMNCSL